MTIKNRTNYNKFSTNRDINDVALEEQEEMGEIKEEQNPLTFIGVVCGCSSLNIREKPSIDSGIVNIVDCGENLELVSGFEKNGFYKIRKNDGDYGYCMKDYISC